MQKFTTPYNTQEEIDNLNSLTKYILKLAKSLDEFKEPVADIGILNKKVIVIKEIHKIEIEQIGIGQDWNNGVFSEKLYGTILFFDTLEHLVNPLVFMKSVNRLLIEGGIAYISIPQRPMWLWTKHHWHEIEPSRCEHLFKEAGFKKEWGKKNSYWKFSPGFVPLVRYFYDKTTL